MLAEMSMRQLMEWRAYADIEPFDEVRADLRAATIVHAIQNTFRKKGSPPVPLKDCVLKFEEEASARPRTVDQARSQIRRTMDLLVAIFGKKES